MGTVVQLLDVDGGSYDTAVVAPTPANPNTFTGTITSVTNTVNVALAPALPTPADVTPQISYVEVTNEESVAAFGVQETPIVVTLLATVLDAELLGRYLVQPIPAYYFSSLTVYIGQCSGAQKTAIAELEIGDQITVTKTFPAPASPTSITSVLTVEGIEHDIDWRDEHTVLIHLGPCDDYLPFKIGDPVAGVIGNPDYGLS